MDNQLLHWSKSELDNLINDQIEESLNLEYKSAAALCKNDKCKSDISKDISAMANSDGGIIIYGIKEFDDNHKRHLPEKNDPILRAQFSKEWLEQVINTNIFPRINDIFIDPITIDENNAVYKVVIPKSYTAHQANDKRYYKRFNFESVAMYDYEIKDIMNRMKSPQIRLEFIFEINTYEVRPFMSTKDERPEYKTNSELKIFAHNVGKVYANYINCYIELPEKFLGKDSYKNNKRKVKDDQTYVYIYCENTKRDILDFQSLSIAGGILLYGPSRYEPLLPQMKNKLDVIPFTNSLISNDDKIYWTIYADNSEPSEGSMKINDIERKNNKL